MSERSWLIAFLALITITNIVHVIHSGFWPSGLIFLSTGLCLLIICRSGLLVKKVRLPVMIGQSLILAVLVAWEWVTDEYSSAMFLQIPLLFVWEFASRDRKVAARRDDQRQF